MKKIRDEKVFSIICKVILMVIEKTNLLNNNELSRYECINCKMVFDKCQKCPCGGTRFILDSEKYKIQQSNIVCGCGKSDLHSTCHYDCDDGFIDEYECSKCNNVIYIYEYNK